MGFTTDFIGHIDIAPSLNEAEITYLTAFSHSRRYHRGGSPYDVPGNPRADDALEVKPSRYNSVAPGQPGLWCDWVPCWGGCCLAFNGKEKFYDPVPWLRYLVTHFLRPGAVAQSSGHESLEGFTFDHVLAGMVVGCRRDNKELYAIRVRNNQVRERILRPADKKYVDRPPLPYELAIDREREDGVRRRRGRKARAVAPVIPLPRGPAGFRGRG